MGVVCVPGAVQEKFEPMRYKHVTDVKLDLTIMYLDRIPLLREESIN